MRALHIKLTFTLCSCVITLACTLVAVRNISARRSVFAWTMFAGGESCILKIYIYDTNISIE